MEHRKYPGLAADVPNFVVPRTQRNVSDGLNTGWHYPSAVNMLDIDPEISLRLVCSLYMYIYIYTVVVLPQRDNVETAANACRLGR